MIPRPARNAILAALGALALTAVALAAPAPKATAVPLLTETFCAVRETVGATLRRDFAETPRLAAQTEGGMTVELWTSDRLGTWTLVHHGRDGMTCIVTTGMDWQAGRDARLHMERALAGTVAQS